MSERPPVPKLFARSARAAALRAGREPAPWPDPAPAIAAAALLSVAACDYRIPLARLRSEGSEGYRDCGCGLTAVCLAGRSAKGDGLVGRECYSCPLAGPSH